MKRVYALASILMVISIPFALGVDVDWDGFKTKVKDKVVPQKDYATREAEYLRRIEKDNIREEYGRKILDRHPSGFMTVEDYEKASKPVDKMTIDYGMPKIDTPYDMQYVPHPIYKITKYNDPPGTPDLTVRREIFQTGQLNLPGITSPDFKTMVYPAVYYYPESAAVSCDLFVIPLRENESSVNKILKANIANRLPEPILSTDKELANQAAYRTLTPIDFSVDGRYILVKEKIGSSEDGIWQTNILVYDFTNKTSYNLVELRAAVSYYWQEYRGLYLDDKRWDIYPLGFSKGNPDRIMATAYAYTGDTPIFLGVWSIDAHGEQSRLISLKNGNIEVASNGFKVVQDGAIDKSLVQIQEKFEKEFAKNQLKAYKKQDKAEVKAMQTEMKAKLKEVDAQFKLEMEEYKLKQKIPSSTSGNESIEKYNELLEALYEKRRLKAEKAEEKQKIKEEKQKEKEERRQLKQQEKNEKESAKREQQENKVPSGQPLQSQTNNTQDENDTQKKYFRH